MQLYQTPTNFTTINHNARIKLGLSWLEYGLADLIYNLANNPKSNYPGWCYASKDKLGNYLGITRKSVHSILNKLEAKGLIEKHSETKHLKTSLKWYDEVIVSNQRLQGVTKSYTNSNQRLHQGVTKGYTTYIYNNNNNNTKGVVCPNKIEGHAGCLEFIESFAKSRNTTIPNKGRQIYALHKILEAGKNFDDINEKIDLMEASYFWNKKGFDLMNVLNEFGKGGENGK